MMNTGARSESPAPPQSSVNGSASGPAPPSGILDSCVANKGGLVNGYHTTGRSGGGLSLSRGVGLVGSNGSLTLHTRSNSLVSNNRQPTTGEEQLLLHHPQRQTGDRVAVLPSSALLLPFDGSGGGNVATPPQQHPHPLSSTASLGRVSKQQLTTTTITTSSSSTAVHRTTTTTVQKRGGVGGGGHVVQAGGASPIINVVDPASAGGVAATTAGTTENHAPHHLQHHHLLQMGPDGQPMDFSGVPRPNQVTVPGPEYVTAGGAAAYGTNPRTHFAPPNNPPTEHPPYDPAMVQDPYVYAAARGVPPDPAERQYGGVNDYAAYGDYEQYPEFVGSDHLAMDGGGSRGGSYHPNYHHHTGFAEHGAPSPQSPSDISNSPSLPPVTPRSANNSEYLRQTGGYVAPGYEELESGVAPRPDYLSTAPTNSHAGNYGIGNTSHYGNLPVRSYLYPEQNDGGNNGGGPVLGSGGDFIGGGISGGMDGGGSSVGRPSPQLPPHASSSSSHLHNHHHHLHHQHQSSSSPSQAAMGSNSMMHHTPGGGSNNGGLDDGGGPQANSNSSSYLMANNKGHFHHHLHHHHPTSSNEEGEASPSSSNQHLIVSAGTSSPGVRWRDPDLHEVIQFLGNPNPVVKANAAAYLQHLCYMDDPVKAKTRALGGIPPLVALLNNDQPEVHRNACGALRNLSYGRQNDENKKAIKSAGGIPALIRLLKRTADNEVKELVTGVLWNLSSCEELKKAIIDDAMVALVNIVIIPHSGWDRSHASGGSASSANNPSHIPDACWSTVFKNASGVLRNVSSAGEYARKKLRECEGLVEALLHVVRCALSRADIDDKSVENCVCILRNLSYRCQEVEDPNYDKHPPPAQSRASAPSQAKGENAGCFGANKKKKESGMGSASPKESNNVVSSTGPSSRGAGGPGGKMDPVRGMELLWQPEVVQAYLALLSNCSNPETLEAAAGAIQNLAACYWQPSIEIRAAVRKEKGLPVLVELLRMEVDRVVCAVATALRNLALDQRNKELIGKYAMRDLVQKLPSGRPHDQGTSDDTIAAVLATLNEVIKKNAEFSRSLMEAEGVERLVQLSQQKRRYSSRVVKFASQVLYSMWQHQELREVYKKAGWSETDFVSKGMTGRSGSPSGPGGSGNEASSAGSPVNANSTLNRPMASQSGTRYEDKTMQRAPNNVVPKSPPPSYTQGEQVPMADMPYPDGGSHAPIPPGAFRMYPPQPLKPGEPLYAQVNREKKKNRHYEGNHHHHHPGYPRGYTSSPSGGDPHWQEHASNSISVEHLANNAPGGDSWV